MGTNVIIFLSLIVMLGFGFFLGLWIGIGAYSKKKKKKRKKYSVTEECRHDTAEIKVLDSLATCETTVIVCSNCGEYLSKPKTET